MVNYALGKIYKLYHVSNPDMIYIGSTCEPTLARRLSYHRDHYKKFLGGKYNFVTSFKILEQGNDIKIELLEQYPCESRDELHKREGYYVRTINCVNKVIPGRSIAEYRIDNKEKISEQQLQYRIQNKEKLAEKRVEYREQNREKMLEYDAQYRLQNKDKIVVLRSEKVHCDICNCDMTKGSLSRHRKTQKHLSKVLAT